MQCKWTGGVGKESAKSTNQFLMLAGHIDMRSSSSIETCGCWASGAENFSLRPTRRMTAFRVATSEGGNNMGWVLRDGNEAIGRGEVTCSGGGGK